MSSSDPRSVVLPSDPVTGFSRSDCLLMLAGPMPRRRCGLLRMGFFRDASKSRDFLCIRIERLAWASDFAQVLETQLDVCQAIAVDRTWSDRDAYLQHCIEMLGQRLHCGTRLDVLAPAILAMNSAWDLLGVFQSLETLPQEQFLD